MHFIEGHNGLKISRRQFLRSGTLTAAVPALSSWSLTNAAIEAPVNPAAHPAFEPNPDFLATAKSTAEWIDSARKQDARGIYWLPEPDHPEKATTGISLRLKREPCIFKTLLLFMAMRH